MKDMSKVAGALGPAEIMAAIQAGANKAEKSAKLAPVFLRRESFAAQACPTGSLVIDHQIGGGIPPGRVIGIAGPEHIGKSLLVTQIANAQLESGRVVVYLDAEGGSDPIFLKARGIDFEKYRGKRNKAGVLKPGQFDHLHMYQPETGDQLANYLHTLMTALPDNRNADAPPVVFILDSVVALISDAISEDIDSNKMAMHAKMYSEIMPIINAQLVRTGCSFVYTNQIRLKPMQQFGNPEYEPAGSSLQFFSSIRFRMNRTKPKLFDKEHPFVDGFITDGEWKADGVWQESHHGNKDELDKYIYTTLTTVKNKVFSPKRVFWIRIQFEKAKETGHGLDPVFDLFTFWANIGLIEKVNKTTWKVTEELKEILKPKESDIVNPIGDQFDYLSWKAFAEQNKWLIGYSRAKLIESGKAFLKEDENDAEVHNEDEGEDDGNQ